MLIIKIHNDGTGDTTIGNYDYTVYINEEKISKGKIESYNRISGWQGLISCLAKQIFDSKGKK